MTSKKRDALKVAVFGGNAAAITTAVGDCTQSIGIPKTIGTLISQWSQKFLTPEEDSLSWGYKAWLFNAKISARQSRANRKTHMLELTDLAKSLSALPIQEVVPSFNNNELFHEASLRNIHKIRPFDRALASLIKRHAIRPARALLYELLQLINELELGVSETLDSIWKILNTLLSTFSLSTLKHPLSTKCPVTSDAFGQHILMLIWNLVIIDGEVGNRTFTLQVMADLFSCNIVSHKQLEERLPILYITCMYKPHLLSYFKQYVDKNPIHVEGDCNYLFEPLLEASYNKPQIPEAPIIKRVVRIRGHRTHNRYLSDHIEINKLNNFVDNNVC